MSHLLPHLLANDVPAGRDPQAPNSKVTLAQSDPFDIDDFTATSEWEKFVAKIEHVVREWGLADKRVMGKRRRRRGRGQASDNSQWAWRQQRSQVTFHDFDFSVVRHYRVKEEEGKKEKGEMEEEGIRDDEDDDEDGGEDEESSLFYLKMMQKDNEELAFERLDFDEMDMTTHEMTPYRKKPEEEDATGEIALPVSLQELMLSQHDFAPQSPALHYFYGLEDFVVLSPAGKKDENVHNATRIKMTLSAITTAAHNTNCQVPLFVQVMSRDLAQFVGVYGDAHFRTNFEMSVLPYTPGDCRNLDDVKFVFRQRLNVPYHVDTSAAIHFPCVISARLTYELEDWTTLAWTQSPPDLDLFAMFGGSLGYINDLSRLPMGTLVDPVKGLLLHAMWRMQRDDVMAESNVATDLKALEAPYWAVRVIFQNDPVCLLGEYLRETLALSQRHESTKQLLGDLVSEEPSNQDENLERLPSALNKLTGPTYSLTDILRAGRQSPKQDKKAQATGPIKDDYLSKILEFLFPDSVASPAYPYPENFSQFSEERYDNYRMALSSIKSAPVNGLVWRLAVVLAHVQHIIGGVQPVAHLLHEFWLEVRHRWETCTPLPGLPLGAPDHAYCLFHQKLQMMNCCIERKLARERKQGHKSDDEEITPETTKARKEEEEESEEDEFFDCDDEDASTRKGDKKSSKNELPIWIQKAEGRRKKFSSGTMKLLEHDDFLYVPICQEPAPMAEDQLFEQAEVMLQLGDDDEGSELRAKMQSASLLSDMESFKAANPGAVLGDFVRWHSPRDWVEDDDEETGAEAAEKKGKLSSRMDAPGNAWLEAWTQAKPVPARRQKRLFDDTREAEKVLQYLTGQTPGECVQLLTPCLLHAAVHRMLDEPVHLIPNVRDMLVETLLPQLTQLSRLLCRPEVRHYNRHELEDFKRRHDLSRDAVQRIQFIEGKISQALSLRAKFLKNALEVKEDAQPDDRETVGQDVEAFVRALYEGGETRVLGAARGPLGQLIRKMFYEAQRAAYDTTDEDMWHRDPLPRPYSKEFILRANVSKPYQYSQACPQRLYCSIRKNGEFRMAAAWSVEKQYL